MAENQRNEKKTKTKHEVQQTFIRLTWVFNIRQTHFETFYFNQKLLLSLYFNVQGGIQIFISINNLLDHFKQIVDILIYTDYSRNVQLTFHVQTI